MVYSNLLEIIKPQLLRHRLVYARFISSHHVSFPFLCSQKLTTRGDRNRGFIDTLGEWIHGGIVYLSLQHEGDKESMGLVFRCLGMEAKASAPLMFFRTA